MTQTFAQLEGTIERLDRSVTYEREQRDMLLLRHRRVRKAMVTLQSVSVGLQIVTFIFNPFTLLMAIGLIACLIGVIFTVTGLHILKGRAQTKHNRMQEQQVLYVDAIAALEERKLLTLMQPDVAKLLEDSATAAIEKERLEKEEQHVKKEFDAAIEKEDSERDIYAWRKQQDYVKRQRALDAKQKADRYRAIQARPEYNDDTLARRLLIADAKIDHARQQAGMEIQSLGADDPIFEMEWATHKGLNPHMQHPEFERAVLYAKYRSAASRWKDKQ
jgi:hypothetical protein